MLCPIALVFVSYHSSKVINDIVGFFISMDMNGGTCMAIGPNLISLSFMYTYGRTVALMESREVVDLATQTWLSRLSSTTLQYDEKTTEEKKTKTKRRLRCCAGGRRRGLPSAMKTSLKELASKRVA